VCLLTESPSGGVSVADVLPEVWPMYLGPFRKCPVCLVTESRRAHLHSPIFPGEPTDTALAFALARGRAPGRAQGGARPPMGYGSSATLADPDACHARAWAGTAQHRAPPPQPRGRGGGVSTRYQTGLGQRRRHGCRHCRAPSRCAPPRRRGPPGATGRRWGGARGPTHSVPLQVRPASVGARVAMNRVELGRRRRRGRAPLISCPPCCRSSCRSCGCWCRTW